MTSFIGYDGKTYDPAKPHEGVYLIRNDGRFWPITFPAADERELSKSIAAATCPAPTITTAG